MTATPPAEGSDPGRLAGAPTSAPGLVTGWVPGGAGFGESGGVPAQTEPGPDLTVAGRDDPGRPSQGAETATDARPVVSTPEAEGSPAPVQPAPPIVPDRHKVESTRTSSLWTAVVAASVLLLVLIVFIAQNNHKVNIHFLWLTGDFSLGLALLVAAVIGALTVATVGVARTMQLRRTASRHRKADALATAAKAPVTGSGAGPGPTTPDTATAAPAGPTPGVVAAGSAVATRPPAQPARKSGFWRRSKS